MGTVVLAGEETHYLSGVLRLGDGDRVRIFDGEGAEFDAELNTADGEATLTILGRVTPVTGVTGPRVTVIAAVIKNRNFDMVVRKCAELGAVSLVPVRTARTVKEAAAGSDRWRKISVEASRQCGRTDVMKVEEVGRFDAAIAGCGSSLRLIAWEGGDEGPEAVPFADALESAGWGGSIAIAVGPEGGFVAGEVETAVAAGFTPVSLGRRILRSETVPLCMLAVVQYSFGDLNGR